MSTIANEIPVTFAGVDRRGTVPVSARGFAATRSTVAELCKAPELPEITVVQSPDPRTFIGASDKLSKFLDVFYSARLPARLILGFKNAAAEDFTSLAPLLARYPGLSNRVEFVARYSDLHSVLLEAYTKVLAARSEKDPLADVPSVAATDRSLRAPSGRIDATKVASTFGLSIAELARQIDTTRQRVSKTSDSEAIQSALRPYERIARLRSVLPDADFKAWLNTPNEHLEDGDAPIAYLKAGAQEPLADFAENMLTGAPA
jgi:hypothetical protein